MSDTTLQAVIDRFLAQKLNINTRRAYRKVLVPFAQDFGTRRPLTSFTDVDLEEWDKLQASLDIAFATHMSRRRHIKAFWNWCVHHRLIEVSPACHLKVKKRHVSLVAKAIPADVLRKMLVAVQEKRCEFARARDSAILALIATFGARAGDVASLRMANINFKEEWIILRTKGDNDLRLPLPPNTAKILDEWLDIRRTLLPGPSHSLVFTNNRTSDGG